VTVRDKTYWTFTLAVCLPGLGKVRLVVSFKNAELTGTYAVLVTNRVDWSAQRIITLYLQRWPIETFYQDGKTHLGLDEYRMRSAEAIKKHWCLVFVAYSFLHLDCLHPSPTKGSLPIKTIGEAGRHKLKHSCTPWSYMRTSISNLGSGWKISLAICSPSNSWSWRDEHSSRTGQNTTVEHYFKK
jgi:DDE family transposase